MKHNGLDIYDIVFDKENHIGVRATSLVTVPAIDSAFVYYGKENPQFKFVNEEKNELVGAIMIPDKLIFRKIKDKSFYVNFTKDVIAELTAYMLQNKTANVFTVQHSVDVENNEVDIREIWVKESENDKSVDFGIDEPIGTAFMKVKINDPIIINAIKENGLNGFSIELDASIMEKREMFNEQEKETSMKITDVFKNTVEVAGQNLYFNDELKKSAYLVFDKEGSPSPYSGEFTYKDVQFVVENGVVTEVVDIQLSMDEKFSRLEEGLTGVTATISDFLATGKTIEEKEAELELLKTQFETEKEDYEKSKGKVEGVKLTLASQVTTNLTSSQEWLGQFKKK